MMTSRSSRIFSRNRDSLADVTSVTHGRTHARTDRTNVKVLIDDDDDDDDDRTSFMRTCK